MSWKQLENCEIQYDVVKIIPRDFYIEGLATDGGMNYRLGVKTLQEDIVLAYSHFHDRKRGAVLLMMPKTFIKIGHVLNSDQNQGMHSFTTWKDGEWLLTVVSYLLVEFKSLYSIKDLLGKNIFES